MASSEYSLVSELSQAYILRQIIEIMIKSKTWVIKWSVRGEAGPLDTNANVVLQILGVFVVYLLLNVASSFF